MKVIALFLLLLLLVGCAAEAEPQQPPSDPETDIVQALNVTLASLIDQHSSDAQIIEALKARETSLVRVARQDPGSVARLKLEESVIAAIRGLGDNAAQLLEIAGTWSGTMEAIVEDDFAHGSSRMRWRIRTADGPIEMFFPKGHRGRQIRSGARIAITGTKAGKYIAVESLSELTAASQPPECTAVGPQNIAVIIVTSPSYPTFPAPGWNAASVQQLFFGTSGVSLNTFWQEASYGKATATGKVFGPYALASDYNCDDQPDLAAAALKAASASNDLSGFKRIAYVFPVPQGCNYGGSAAVGCVAAVTMNAFFPVFSVNLPQTYIGIVAHEEGHNLGLDHANSDDYGTVSVGALDDPGLDTEYGDPFSVMGSPNGSESTWNAQPIMGQYSADQKSLILRWLTLPDYLPVRTSGMFTLAPYESGSGIRALRILRDAASSSWLWAEYRQPLGLIDSTLSLIPNYQPTNVFQGALIHYEDPLLDSLHSHLLDFNPVAAPNSFYTPVLLSGQSWSDPYSLLTLTAGPAAATGLPITVNYDQPCATLRSSAPVFPPSGGTGSIAVSAPASCSWTATTNTSWLKLTGPLSGQGNGVVGFAVSPDQDTGSARNGYITIQRQSVQVSQTGTGISLITSTPSAGSGDAGQFTFVVNDTNGVSDIRTVYVEFANAVELHTLPSCDITVGPSNSAAIALQSDDAINWLGPIYPGSSATLSNSQCTFSAAGTSVTGSGNQLQVTVQLAFAPAFAGEHGIYVLVLGKATGFSNYFPAGSWTVTPPAATGPAVTSVNAASFTPGLALASNSIASAFGNHLATQTATAAGTLGSNLDGTTVNVTDAHNTTVAAQVFFVSPGQVNYLIPPTLSPGLGQVQITAADGTVSVGPLQIATSAPGLFTADGKIAVGSALLIDAKGNQTILNLATYNSASGQFQAAPIPLAATSYAILYGTGFGNGLNTQFSASIGGIAVTPVFAGPQGTFAGLDQMNIPIPASLAGAGDVAITLTAAGSVSNTVHVTVQ